MKAKKYIRFKNKIIDTSKCHIEHLAEQECFVDEDSNVWYPSFAMKSSDKLEDLWVEGDLVFYEDIAWHSQDCIVVNENFINPFGSSLHIPSMVYAKVGNDYKLLMLKDRKGEWQLCK